MTDLRTSRKSWAAAAVAVLLAVALLATPSLRAAEDVVVAKPESVGMSSERLKRIDSFIQEYIDSDRIVGAVTLVARKGKVVHFEAQGWRDKENGVPMTEDSIFVLMSMTKPIVSSALMMLFEEGRFLLDDPISKWIPEYENHTVRINRRRRTAADRAGGAAGHGAPRADAHVRSDAESARQGAQPGADRLCHQPRQGLADAGRKGGARCRDSRRVPPRRRMAVRRWVWLFFVDDPGSFGERHGKSYLTRRRRGGAGGGGGSLTGGAVLSAYRWA